MAQKTIALLDASPLIGLARIGALSWLPELYAKAFITSCVRAEALPGLDRPGEKEIRAALRRKWIAVLRGKWSGPPTPGLGEGETSILRAALKCGPGALVIVDDPAARRAARKLGLAFTGTAGVVVEAKRARLIPRARPVLERLLEAGSHMAPELVGAILEELGET